MAAAKTARGKWNPAHHPRDSRGRFTRSATRVLKGSDGARARAAVTGFKPANAGMTGPGAGKDVLARVAKGQTTTNKAMTDYLAGGWKTTNPELRTKKDAGADPAVVEMDKAFTPLPEDILVERRVPLKMFAHIPVDQLEGMKVRDAAPASTVLDGTAGELGDGMVTMHIAVPAGTPAFVNTDGGEGEILLARDTETAISKAVPNGRGGWDLFGVVIPRQGAGRPASKKNDQDGAPPAPPGGPVDDAPKLPGDTSGGPSVGDRGAGGDKTAGTGPARARKAPGQADGARAKDDNTVQDLSPGAKPGARISRDDAARVMLGDKGAAARGIPPRTPDDTAAADQIAAATPIGLHRDGDQLSDTQRAALSVYQDGSTRPGMATDHKKVNAALRSGEQPGPAEQDTIDGIDSVMDASKLTEDVDVFRGVRPARGLFSADQLAGDLTGVTWRDDAYVSAGPSEADAAAFTGKGDALLMRLHVPAGTGAVDMRDPDDPSENELLLDRGHEYRVTADNGVVDGFRRIDVEALPKTADDVDIRRAGEDDDLAGAAAAAVPTKPASDVERNDYIEVTGQGYDSRGKLVPKTQAGYARQPAYEGQGHNKSWQLYLSEYPDFTGEGSIVNIDGPDHEVSTPPPPLGVEVKRWKSTRTGKDMPYSARGLELGAIERDPDAEAKTRARMAQLAGVDPADMPPAPPAPGSKLAAMTPIDRAALAVAVEDAGPGIFQSPLTGRSFSDVGRYVSEYPAGRPLVDKYGAADATAAIEEYARANPSILARTPDEVKARKAERLAQASDQAKAAAQATKNGTYQAARRAIDKGELIDPNHRENYRSWDEMRAIVGRIEEKRNADDAAAAAISDKLAADQRGRVYDGIGDTIGRPAPAPGPVTPVADRPNPREDPTGYAAALSDDELATTIATRGVLPRVKKAAAAEQERRKAGTSAPSDGNGDQGNTNTPAAGNGDQGAGDTAAPAAPVDARARELADAEKELADAEAAMAAFNYQPSGNMRTKSFGQRNDAALRRMTGLVDRVRKAEQRLAAARRPARPVAPPGGFTPEDLAGAKFIRTKLGWYEVVKVNKASVKVKADRGMDDLIPRRRIIEHRGDSDAGNNSSGNNPDSAGNNSSAGDSSSSSSNDTTTASTTTPAAGDTTPAAPDAPAAAAAAEVPAELAGFNTADQGRLRIAAMDKAAEYAGSPLIGKSPSSVARYVAEGPMRDFTAQHGQGPTQAALTRMLTDDPSLMDRTPEQIAADKAARKAKSDGVDLQAVALIDAGDLGEALSLIDDAEKDDPDWFTSAGPSIVRWPDMRDIAREYAASKGITDGDDSSDGGGALDLPASTVAPLGEDLDTPPPLAARVDTPATPPPVTDPGIARQVLASQKSLKIADQTKGLPKEARDAADETGRSGATNIKWGHVDSFGNLSDAAGYPVGRVAGGSVTQPAPGIAGWVYVDTAIPGASGGTQQISVWRPGRPAPVPVNPRAAEVIKPVRTRLEAGKVDGEYLYFGDASFPKLVGEPAIAKQEGRGSVMFRGTDGSDLLIRQDIGNRAWLAPIPAGDTPAPTPPAGRRWEPNPDGTFTPDGTKADQGAQTGDSPTPEQVDAMMYAIAVRNGTLPPGKKIQDALTRKGWADKDGVLTPDGYAAARRGNPQRYAVNTADPDVGRDSTPPASRKPGSIDAPQPGDPAEVPGDRGSRPRVNPDTTDPAKWPAHEVDGLWYSEMGRDDANRVIAAGPFNSRGEATTHNAEASKARAGLDDDARLAQTYDRPAPTALKPGDVYRYGDASGHPVGSPRRVTRVESAGNGAAVVYDDHPDGVGHLTHTADTPIYRYKDAPVILSVSQGGRPTGVAADSRTPDVPDFATAAGGALPPARVRELLDAPTVGRVGTDAGYDGPRTLHTFDPALSAPKLAQTVNVNGRDVDIVQYARIRQDRIDAPAELEHSELFYAVPAGTKFNRLTAEFRTRPDQYNADRKVGDRYSGQAGTPIGQYRDNHLASGKTPASAAAGARRALEKQAAHDRFARDAEHNIGVHDYADFQALDPNAEIRVGDLVMLNSHNKMRTAVVTKVTATKVEALAATPTGQRAVGASGTKGSEVRLLRARNLPETAPARPADRVDAPVDQVDQVDAPDAGPAPIPAGVMNDAPLSVNGWDAGNLESTPVNYHDSGEIGQAVRDLGADARLDVDGLPLAEHLGRLATATHAGRLPAQDQVDELRTLRDRLPDGPGKRAVAGAVAQLDTPRTPTPPVPDSAPAPLRTLMDELHAIPSVRRNNAETDRLAEILNRFDTGKISALGMKNEVRSRILNNRHESVEGKADVDRAALKAIAGLDEMRRTDRESLTPDRQRALFTASNPAAGTSTPDAPAAPAGPASARDVAQIASRRQLDGDYAGALAAIADGQARFPDAFDEPGGGWDAMRASALDGQANAATRVARQVSQPAGPALTDPAEQRSAVAGRMYAGQQIGGVAGDDTRYRMRVARVGARQMDVYDAEGNKRGSLSEDKTGWTVTNPAGEKVGKEGTFAQANARLPEATPTPAPAAANAPSDADLARQLVDDGLANRGTVTAPPAEPPVAQINPPTPIPDAATADRIRAGLATDANMGRGRANGDLYRAGWVDDDGFITDDARRALADFDAANPPPAAGTGPRTSPPSITRQADPFALIGGRPAGAALEDDLFGATSDFVPQSRGTLGMADRADVGRTRGQAAVQQLGMFDVADERQMEGQTALLDSLLQMPEAPPPVSAPVLPASAPEPARVDVPEDLSGWTDEQMAGLFGEVSAQDEYDEVGTARIMAEWDRREKAMADVLAKVPDDLSTLNHDQAAQLYADVTSHHGTMDTDVVARLEADLDRRDTEHRAAQEAIAGKRALVDKPPAEYADDDELAAAMTAAADLGDEEATYRIADEWDRREQAARDRQATEAAEAHAAEAAATQARVDQEAAAAAEVNARAVDAPAESRLIALDDLIDQADTAEDAANRAADAPAEPGMADKSQTDLYATVIQKLGSPEAQAAQREIARREDGKARSTQTLENRRARRRLLNRDVTQLSEDELVSLPALLDTLPGPDGVAFRERKLAELRKESTRRQQLLDDKAARRAAGPDGSYRRADPVTDYNDVEYALTHNHGEDAGRWSEAKELALGLQRKPDSFSTRPRPVPYKEWKKAVQADQREWPEIAQSSLAWYRHLTEIDAPEKAENEGRARDFSTHHGFASQPDAPEPREPIGPADVAKADMVLYDMRRAAVDHRNNEGDESTYRRYILAQARAYRIPHNENASLVELRESGVEKKAGEAAARDPRSPQRAAADIIAEFRRLAAEDGVDPADSARFGPADRKSSPRRAARGQLTSDQQSRLQAHLARGHTWEQAYAEAIGIDQVAMRRQEADDLMRQSFVAKDLAAAYRMAYTEHVMAAYQAAEDGTRGHLLNDAGKQLQAKGKLSASELFSGSSSRAYKYASEELKRWWGEHPPPRLTFAEWKANMQGDPSAMASAIQKAKGNEFA